MICVCLFTYLFYFVNILKYILGNLLILILILVYLI